MIAIGSLGIIFVSPRFLFYHFFSFMIAAGLLFMGLDFMKSGMAQFATLIHIRELEKYGPLAYFLFGLIVTAVIHSSSAMMTMTLGALFANIISLPSAAFIVIGADLGTTMTALVASMRGTSVKKRVGLAHFFFNFVTALIAVLIVIPTLSIIQENFQINQSPICSGRLS